jgi:hypothetical protein
MEQTLRWDFLKPDYARTSAPLKWNDKTEPYRPGRTTRLLEIEVLSSVRPAAGDRPEVPTNAYPYRLAEPEGILISGQIQSFSHVYTAGGSDPGVGDDVFVPMLSFKRFLSQAELEAPARDQLLQDVLVAMLDALADTINAPDFIQTLD